MLVLHYPATLCYVLDSSYQELINAVTELFEDNANMSMEVKPVQHTNAVTTDKHTNICNYEYTSS